MAADRDGDAAASAWLAESASDAMGTGYRGDGDAARNGRPCSVGLTSPDVPLQEGKPHRNAMNSGWCARTAAAAGRPLRRRLRPLGLPHKDNRIGPTGQVSGQPVETSQHEL